MLSGLAQGVAIAQQQTPTAPPASVLEERLRDAQVTRRTLANGATFTEVKFAGSLQPNVELGCVSMKEVTSEINPPALLRAAKTCIRLDHLERAWMLMTTGLGFAYHDLKRLADRSTQGARTVLSMNTYADLTNAQREASDTFFKKLQTDPEKVASYCIELTRIGPPTYEPLWAILHGIGAYQEPRNGHYLANIDSKALWDEVLKTRCTALKPPAIQDRASN